MRESWETSETLEFVHKKAPPTSQKEPRPPIRGGSAHTSEGAPPTNQRWLRPHVGRSPAHQSEEAPPTSKKKPRPWSSETPPLPLHP